ncbi:hypothetical protein ACJX0J_028930, partial [Zea mays]
MHSKTSNARSYDCVYYSLELTHIFSFTCLLHIATRFLESWHFIYPGADFNLMLQSPLTTTIHVGLCRLNSNAIKQKGTHVFITEMNSHFGIKRSKNSEKKQQKIFIVYEILQTKERRIREESKVKS